MHGMIFREFFLFVEDATSKGFVKDMLRAAGKPDSSEYDASGPYDQEELIGMMSYLARQTGYKYDEICNDFGRRLFHRFSVLHPEAFENQTMALDFLQGIEAHIHEKVRTLVPKSNPPSFDVKRRKQSELVLHYRSERPFADLCAGLIDATLEHFDVNGRVDCQSIGDAKSEAIFTITTHN